MISTIAPEWRFARLLAGAAMLGLVTGFVAAPPAHALSEIQEEDVPLPEGGSDDDEIRREELPPPRASDEKQEQDDEAGEEEEVVPEVAPPPAGMPVPLPDPIVNPRDPAPSDRTETEENEPVPEVLYDVELLPEPVRRMREMIMEACLSGDIERLRPLISGGEDGTQLTFSGKPADPIEFLRDVSGDDEGHEVLAILYEVLAAGYVHLDDNGRDMYVWPYFFAVPLEALSAPQRVELFKLVTAGDYEDMKNYGAYIFYRVGISAEGRWMFFVAGD